MAITALMVKELREATDAGVLDCKNALETHGGDMGKALAYLREKGLKTATEKASRATLKGLVVIRDSGDEAGMVVLNCETDFVAQTDQFKALAHRLADQVWTDPALGSVEGLLAADRGDGLTNAAALQDLIARLDENIVVGDVARYRLQGAGVVESYIHSGAEPGFYAVSEGRIGVLIELGVEAGIAVDRAALRDLAHDLSLHIASFGPRYLAPQDVPAEVVDHERAELLADLAHETKPDAIKAKIVEGRLNKFYERVCLLRQVFVRDDTLTIEALLKQKTVELGAVITIRRFARFDVGV
jgi:elongation factor Ts